MTNLAAADMVRSSCDDGASATGACWTRCSRFPAKNSFRANFATKLT